jgi:phosphopantetheine adenylyltransferase
MSYIHEQYGFTPLHCAAESGSLDVLKLLLDKGAKVNAEDNVRKLKTRIVHVRNYVKTKTHFYNCFSLRYSCRTTPRRYIMLHLKDVWMPWIY